VVSDSFSAEHPDLVVLYNLISSFGQKPTAGAMIAAMSDAAFSDEELWTLDQPVRLLAAEHDPFCPPRVMEAVARRFKKADCLVLPGAGHSAYYEQPASWNRAVLEFIRPQR